jgi:hypothetical protein
VGGEGLADLGVFEEPAEGRHHRQGRAGPGQPWVRLDGFASADDILREVHQLTSN